MPSPSHSYPGGGGKGGGVRYSFVKVENGGLGSDPSLKMEGFQSGPSLKNEGDFGTKNNKETFIFKRGSFWSSPGRKSGINKSIFLKKWGGGGGFRSSPGRNSGVFRNGPAQKIGGGAFGRHIPVLP